MPSPILRNSSIIVSAVLLFVLFNPLKVYSKEAMSYGFIGIITKSARHGKGSQYIFANINSKKPMVTYPSGFGNETMKVYEDDDLIVLFYIASATGSTETYYINRKSKRFTLIEVGAYEASVEEKDCIPMVSYGYLK